MPDFIFSRFADVKIGDFFFIHYGDVIRTYIRCDAGVNTAVDLASGLIWNFKMDDEVYIYPDRYEFAIFDPGRERIEKW